MDRCPVRSVPWGPDSRVTVMDEWRVQEPAKCLHKKTGQIGAQNTWPLRKMEPSGNVGCGWHSAIHSPA